jgi:hypothetical protein
MTNFLCKHQARNPVVFLATPHFLVTGADNWGTTSEQMDLTTDVVVATRRRPSGICTLRDSKFARHATPFTRSRRQIGAGDSSGDSMRHLSPHGSRDEARGDGECVESACGLACASMRLGRHAPSSTSACRSDIAQPTATDVQSPLPSSCEVDGSASHSLSTYLHNGRVFGIIGFVFGTR